MTHTTPDLSAGNSLPAVPMGKDVKIRERIDVPQREDYVPPVLSDVNRVMVPISSSDLLAIHKFIEVNAIQPEDREMADKLRLIMESF